MTECIGEYLEMCQTHNDFQYSLSLTSLLRSLFSKRTAIEQDLCDDYWNFDENEAEAKEDPLVEKYFAKTLDTECDAKSHSLHKRSESQSSGVLSVGSSAPDSEVCETSTPIAAILAHQSPSLLKGSNQLQVKAEAAREDGGEFLPIFPRATIRRNCDPEEAMRIKELLIAIKDTEEELARPWPLIKDKDEKRGHLQGRVDLLNHLRLLNDEAEEIFNSHL